MPDVRHVVHGAAHASCICLPPLHLVMQAWCATQTTGGASCVTAAWTAGAREWPSPRFRPASPATCTTCACTTSACGIGGAAAPNGGKMTEGTWSSTGGRAMPRPASARPDGIHGGAGRSPRGQCRVGGIPGSRSRQPMERTHRVIALRHAGVRPRDGFGMRGAAGGLVCQVGLALGMGGDFSDRGPGCTMLD